LPGERFDVITTPCHDVLGDLLHGDTTIIEYQPDTNNFCTKTISNATILSGSFNPIHAGHRELLATAIRMSGQVGYCELSVINADKPPLDYSVITQRASLFSASPSLILTRAPRFIDKAALMPGSTFVLGYDTVVRLLNPKYYPDGDVSGSSPNRPTRLPLYRAGNALPMMVCSTRLMPKLSLARGAIYLPQLTNKPSGMICRRLRSGACKK
jgi:hypothetical protein